MPPNADVSPARTRRTNSASDAGVELVTVSFLSFQFSSSSAFTTQDTAPTRKVPSRSPTLPLDGVRMTLHEVTTSLFNGVRTTDTHRLAILRELGISSRIHIEALARCRPAPPRVTLGLRVSFLGSQA